MNKYGIKDTKYFNKKTGAIIVCLTDGLELGDEWLNLTNNPGWVPLFDIDRKYIGYTRTYKDGKTFVYREDEFLDEDKLNKT